MYLGVLPNWKHLCKTRQVEVGETVSLRELLAHTNHRHIWHDIKQQHVNKFGTLVSKSIVCMDGRHVLYRLAKSQGNFCEVLEGMIKCCSFIHHRIKEIA